MKYIVDRIENKLAVCENENMDIENISLDVLPPGVREGNVIFLENGQYILLADEEEERRRKILQLQDDIFYS